MKTNLFTPMITALGLCLTLIACSSSDETMNEDRTLQPVQPSATEVVQRDMLALRARNDSLAVLVGKLELDNELAATHAAELETRLAAMRQRSAAVPAAQHQQDQRFPPGAAGDDAYEQGLQLFRSRNYHEAAGRFKSMLDAGAPPDLQDNCHYWLGECAYAMRNFQEAIGHFNEIFTFKVSEKKDDAQMMIANSYFAMGNTATAKAEYQKLIDKYPASPYVTRAKQKMSKL